MARTKAPRRPPRRPRPPAAPDPLVGTTIVLEVGPIAHGGHAVARHDGRVVFVRHALPGERVRVLVTEGRAKDSFLRGDAVEVLESSAHRVEPPCRYAGPATAEHPERGCGGCDLQHVDLGHQRELKADVVREQFRRLARLDVDDLALTGPTGLVVEGLPGIDAGDGEPEGDQARGLRWRTRVELAVDETGRPGLREHRSHRVVLLNDCLIADRRISDSGAFETTWTGCSGVDVVAADDPAEAVLVALPTTREPPVVLQHVETPTWSGDFGLSARGFWQVHPAAAPTFVDHVLRELDPTPGDRALDLYAGVGLFALALADAVGETGSVLAVEGDARAVADGGVNLEDRPQVEYRCGPVDDVLGGLVDQGVTADLVVLDPPRTGAGRQVVTDLAALGARTIVYVACDPAALARDVSYLAEVGYRLRALRAVDAFPMTHHVECLATFGPESVVELS